MKCLVIPTDSEPEEEAGPMIIPPKIDQNETVQNKRPRTPSPHCTPGLYCTFIVMIFYNVYLK